MLPGEHLTDGRLVGGIGVGVDEAHRNRLHPEFDELLHLSSGVVEIQGFDHVSVHTDSFDHLQTPRAFDQRLGFLPGHVIQLWNTQPSQLEDIGEPRGGQQTRQGAFLSRMALVATVLPCTTSRVSAGSTP